MLNASVFQNSFLDGLSRRLFRDVVTSKAKESSISASDLRIRRNVMSGKNGDRARFNRQRKAKMHDRTRIREMRKALQAPKANLTEKAQ